MQAEMSKPTLHKTIRRGLIIALSLAIATTIFFTFGTGDRVIARDIGGDGVGKLTLLSRSYTIDRLYQSMEGPFGEHQGVRLVESSPRQLLWITGMYCELVGPDGKEQRPQDFFCHSNLTFSPQKNGDEHDATGRTRCSDGRLFTLIPGCMKLSLPADFAVPVYSDEALDCFTMSLNLNHVGEPVKIRFRTTVDFAAANEIKTPMKPLFRRALYAFEPIGKMSPHTMCMGGDKAGAACGPFVGKAASNAFLASIGKTNTVHWLIPPGHFESKIDVTDQMDLPYDTTAHHVTAHLHPFGKSVSLRDATAGKTLFKVHSKDYDDRKGVQTMEQWSSVDGVNLVKGHDYELVTEYFNPTDKPIDAMSILYIYALDKKFLP
jgi:hypothetical protein